jgi:hypothetical protein
MNLPETLGLISGALLIAGYIPYIYEVLKGQTKPSRMSWFIWALSTTIILFGVHETGTNEAIWVPVADAIGCTAIFLLAIWRGVGGWTKVDKISLGICVASLIVLAVTGDAFIALLMNLCIYVSGYISTIKKAMIDPKSESLVAWSMFFGGVILNLITVAIGNDTGLAVWLYPIVLVATVGTLFYFLVRPVRAEL